MRFSPGGVQCGDPVFTGFFLTLLGAVRMVAIRVVSDFVNLLSNRVAWNSCQWPFPRRWLQLTERGQD